MDKVALTLQLAEAKNCITFKACASAYGMRDNRTNEAYTSWMNSMNNLLTSNIRMIPPADYVNFDELIEHHEKMLNLVNRGGWMVSAEKIQLKEAYTFLLMRSLELKALEGQPTELLRKVTCKWAAICEIMEDLNIIPIKTKEYESYPFLREWMKELNLTFDEGGCVCFATQS